MGWTRSAMHWEALWRGLAPLQARHSRRWGTSWRTFSEAKSDSAGHRVARSLHDVPGQAHALLLVQASCSMVCRPELAACWMLFCLQVAVLGLSEAEFPQSLTLRVLMDTRFA